jgi:hypothetical protein
MLQRETFCVTLSCTLLTVKAKKKNGEAPKKIIAAHLQNVQKTSLVTK